MDMTDGICDVIAKHVPYTRRDIRVAYDICHSYDFVISACDLAMTRGCSFGQAFSLLMKAAQHNIKPTDAPSATPDNKES